jgi:hypothetical protein
MSLYRSVRRSCVGIMLHAVFVASACGQATPQEVIDWGPEVYANTAATMKVAGSALFAETASLNGNQYGGDTGFAYVWPLSTQFRVQNSLARVDPATYVPILRQFSDEARTRYWSAAGGGYRSGVSSGSTRFYDDNAHVAVALMEAYRITSDPVFLTRGRETYEFVISGEDAVGGGGIYFHEADHSTKETISTLQAARAALMLYQATDEASYLTDATRLYEWARTHTQQPDGLFLEKYYLTGAKAGMAGDFALVNAAGDAISVNLEFYASTGDIARLQEAQRIATRSLTRYFNSATGAINDEGYWAFELVDSLDDLSRVAGDPTWLAKIMGALEWLHDNRRDPNGHYGTLWGRGGFQGTALFEWHLNDQASVARSYLHTGLTMLATSPMAGDYNQDGIVDAVDYVMWRKDDGTQLGYDTWRAHYGKTTTSRNLSNVNVPEPAALILIILMPLGWVSLSRQRLDGPLRFRWQEVGLCLLTSSKDCIDCRTLPPYVIAYGASRRCHGALRCAGFLGTRKRLGGALPRGTRGSGTGAFLSDH